MKPYEKDPAARAYFAGMAEIRTARSDGAPGKVRFKRALQAASSHLAECDDEPKRATIREMLKVEALRRGGFER